MDDAQLICRFRNGDASAFVELLRHHEDTVYGFACRMLGSGMEAEDVAQETFVRAYERIGEVDRPERLRSWLLSVAANLCRDHFRQVRYRQHLSLEREVDLERELPDSTQPAADAMRERRVRAAIAALDEDKRLVVVLREYHELTYEEIAAVAGCPIGTVRWRLHAARRQLRRALDDLLE